MSDHRAKQKQVRRGDEPSAVVQVDDKGLISKLFKRLIMVSIHVPCGNTNTQLSRNKQNKQTFTVASCHACRLTHEEVKDGHVHDVQQPCATVVRWRLFDFLAVVWVHLPPEEHQTNSVRTVVFSSRG